MFIGDLRANVLGVMGTELRINAGCGVWVGIMETLLGGLLLLLMKWRSNNGLNQPATGGIS